MDDFRDVTRKKMAEVPFLNSSMNMSTGIWAVGMILLILGQFIAFANAICSDLFTGLGFWIMWFGILLSFVKKDEYGVIIPLAACSATYLVMFIIALVYHVLSLSSIIHFFAYGGLAFLAYKHSTLKRRVDNNRAQSMTNYKNIQGGFICSNCGSVMPGEAMFCTVCGAKRAVQKFCTGCGRPLTPNDAFCPGCGTKQN